MPIPVPIQIQIDYRENPSGIPNLLACHSEITTIISSLPAGDYVINKVIGVERKTADDLVQSIISNRLFEQLARLKKT